jgi:hypothetical protein
MSVRMTKATLAEVRPLIVGHHYSRCVPQMPVHVFAWREIGGLFGDAGEPVAAAVYGVPVNRAWPKDALELQRLVRSIDDLPPLSALLGASLRWLQQHDPRGFVLSYADTRHGHHGGVYQAAGFTYVGETRNFVGQYYEDADGRLLHGRAIGRLLGTTSMARVAELRPDLTPSAGSVKHLYVKPLRQRLGPLLRRFGWVPLPFPKPDRAIRPLDEAVPAVVSPKHPRGIAPISTGTPDGR